MMGNWRCEKHNTNMDERSTSCPYCEILKLRASLNTARQSEIKWLETYQSEFSQLRESLLEKEQGIDELQRYVTGHKGSLARLNRENIDLKNSLVEYQKVDEQLLITIKELKENLAEKDEELHKLHVKENWLAGLSKKLCACLQNIRRSAGKINLFSPKIKLDK